MPKRSISLYLSLSAIALVFIVALQRLYIYVGAESNTGIAFVAIIIILQVSLGLSIVGIGIIISVNIYFHKCYKTPRQFLTNRKLPALIEKLLVGGKFIQSTGGPKSDSDTAITDQELISALKAPKRRGRRSAFPYAKRRKAVLDWERRGTFNTLTLQEFLDERFGTSGAGVSNVPAATFYDWRREIINAVKQQGGTTKQQS